MAISNTWSQLKGQTNDNKKLHTQFWGWHLVCYNPLSKYPVYLLCFWCSQQHHRSHHSVHRMLHQSSTAAVLNTNTHTHTRTHKGNLDNLKQEEQTVNRQYSAYLQDCLSHLFYIINYHKHLDYFTPLYNTMTAQLLTFAYPVTLTKSVNVKVIQTWIMPWGVPTQANVN